MSKVTFSFYNETLFNGYKANEPGDHSGDYYPAAKVRALVEAAKGARDSLRYVEDNMPGRSGFGVRQMRISELDLCIAALEAEDD